MRKQFLMGLIFAAIAGYSCISDSWAGRVIAASGVAETEYSSQVNYAREIKVTVTPQNITSEAKTWDFQLVLETHKGDLSDDMVKSSVLVADGKQYLPLSWEGAPPGGHHRKGVLRFKTITPQPQSMELQIRLNGEASPRSFEWRLK